MSAGESTSWSETTPSWFARFAAWAVPAERPSHEVVEEAALAAAELWIGRAIAQALAKPDELPYPVEMALRTHTAEGMDVGAWVAIHTVLQAHGQSADPTSANPAVTSVAEALGCSPSLIHLLEAAGAGDVPEGYVGALGTLLAEQPDLRKAPLCWIRGVERSDGTTHIHFRKLVGTSHPALRTLSVDHAPTLPEDHLVFWDGDGPALAVPHWLARWDAHTRQVRWFNGRDPDGRVRYRGWSGSMKLPRMPEDAPVFLRDDALSTPNPASPLPTLPSAMPSPAGAERLQRTLPMAKERVSLPPVSQPAATTASDPLVLRVLTTRYVLRYARVPEGGEVVIGRNSDHASFVLAHHQLSRAHTRVRQRGGTLWVCDMGSTNGTQLNGHDVGREEVPAKVGDVVAAGPVLMRLERVPEEHLARLDVVTGLRPAPERDPLTRLLLPKHLAEHLPETLRAGFQDGGEPVDGQPSLWGVVLRLDRLHAIHAQLGQAVADAAFAITARLVQGHAPDPLAVMRIGYGELLVPLVGVDEAGARAKAAELVRLLREQPWEPPLTKLPVTAAIGDKRTDEGAGVWVSRIRAGMPSPTHSSPGES